MNIVRDREVGSPPELADAQAHAGEMIARMRAALIRQAEIDLDAITLRRDGRRIVLTGTVSSDAARHFAAMAMWGLPGVAIIDNRIRVVRSWPEPDEEARGADHPAGESPDQPSY